MPSPFPEVQMRIALGNDPFDTAPTFTDIGPDGMSLNTSRGRSFELDDVTAGHASASVRNTTRKYDPTFAAGPYFGQLTVNKRMNFRARWDSINYFLLDGYIDSITQPSPADKSNRYAQTDFDVTDAFKFLSRPNSMQPIGSWIVGDPVYGTIPFIVGGNLHFPTNGESCGDRINQILDLWPWPASTRDIDDGLTPLIADDDPTRTGQDTALSYVKKIADSDAGRLFVSADGHITFWSRDHWQSTSSQLHSQATFSDAPGAGEFGYQAITMDPADDRYIRNTITRDRYDFDTPFMARSSASLNSYGPIEDSRTILTQDLDDIRNQAHWLLLKYRDPSVRVSSITVNPGRDPDNLFPLVLGLELGDRITVERRIAKIGGFFTQDYWIERISHQVSAASRTWLTTWGLSPVDSDIYDPASFVEAGSVAAVSPSGTGARHPSRRRRRRSGGLHAR